jgi:hypothetical protein
MNSPINIDGIIIPDNSPLFLTLIGIHVLAALVCIVAALFAIFTTKTNKLHPKVGTIYFRSLFIVFITSITLSIIRWPADNHLLVLGSLSFGLTFIGRMAQRKKMEVQDEMAFAKYDHVIYPSFNCFLCGQWEESASLETVT